VDSSEPGERNESRGLSDRTVRILFSLLLGALVWAAFVALNTEAALADFPMDDAWIHQVYVRSLATEGTLSYNPGTPEAGFSSLLWVLVQVPFHLVGIAPHVYAKLVGLAFCLLAGFGASRVASSLGASSFGSAVALLLVAVTPAFAFSAVSGMEVTLTSALLFHGVAELLRGRTARSGVLLGLAGLARPEVGVSVLVCALWWSLRPDRRAGVGRDLVRLLAPAALMGGAWMVLNIGLTGHPLPTTFYVKGGGASLDLIGRTYARSVLLQPGALWAGVTALLIAIGLARTARERSRRPGLALLLAVQLVGLAAVAFTREPGELATFSLHRYYLPFTMFDVVLVGLGVEAISARVGERWGAARARLIAVVPLALVALPLLEARVAYAGHCEDTVQLHTNPAREAGTWVDPDGLIAVEGAGASRYHSQRNTLDLLGLNYADLAHAGDDHLLRTCLIVGNRPELVIVPVEWLEVLASIFELEEVSRARRAEWAAVGGAIERVVVTARARARPATLARCAAEYGAQP